MEFAILNPYLVDLAHRHASKMAKVESTKRAQLQERAEAFTSAFKEDLEFYRTHGRPDSKLYTYTPAAKWRAVSFHSYKAKILHLM